MSTFVLVHGAGHGRWCWHKLIPQLERDGHRVIAVDLPGLGQDNTPPSEVGLDDFANRIENAIHDVDDDVVLVGHSLGGIALSAVAERSPERISHLVYLTAYLVPANKSLSEFQSEDERLASLGDEKRTKDLDRGVVVMNDSAIREYYYNECAEEDISLAKLLMRPTPIGPTTDPIVTTEKNFGSIPRTYIKCSKDKAIPPFFQSKMCRMTTCEEVHTLDADHSPFYSATDELAGILTEK